ncbi:MAG: AAA family ATPase [Candidatus Pacebacteria bacterium]|nr:AAA family ATPase [Candidatus Paceibacterota bacterium]MCF7857628.1 AAA family ATPase [Candidatus Paceibacterota bacterium]
MSWLLIIGGLVVAYAFGASRNKAPVQPVSGVAPLTKQTLPKKLNVEREDISNIDLSDEQKKVFEILETTSSTVYITGKAGTGKSVLLQYFTEHTQKSVAVVAPTGVAALNVGGQTIHSFFKLAPEVLDPKEIKIDYKTKEILRHVDAIVIDEVSMVRVDLMEAINVKMQLACGNKLPFGGVQIIMFGDLYQLPPVVTDGQLQRYFDHTYGGVFFFNAPVFKERQLKIYELNYIFRQKDPEFRELLNAIRNGVDTESALLKINERQNVTMPEDGFVTLAGTNATVSGINSAKLAKLPGDIHTYVAEITGDIQQSAFPTEKELKLKVGSQVMMLKNDLKKPARWVNGTLAVITKLTSDSIRVNIDGVEHSVSRESWDKIRYNYNHEEIKLEKEIVSSFKQFPMRLAWAITIHKSQGQTYESVAIDLTDGAFVHGQTYVALSRCKSMDGIYLKSPIRSQDIIIDQEIIEFMKGAEVTK